MTIAILPSARSDLDDGYHFYEGQGEGLGDYFLGSLSSDVDSLRLYAEFIGKYSAITARYPSASRMQFIMIWPKQRFASGRFSIAGKIRTASTGV